MAASTGFVSTIEKLDGRDNFSTWQFAVKAYLEHQKLWNCVLGTEVNEEKIVQAKSIIILLLKPINYVHIKTCTTAKEVWDKLQLTFQDSGLYRRVSLIRELTGTKLVDCSGVEDYVNKVMSAAHKLNDLDGSISDDWIGTFLLAGLSDHYKPMIMAIENSGVAITSDYIKTKLLQDVKSSDNTSAGAFYSSKPQSNFNHNSRGPRCFECGDYGHISTNCWKKNEPKSNSERTYNGTGSTNNSVAGNKWKGQINAGKNIGSEASGNFNFANWTAKKSDHAF
jgi:hypothetical protein